MKTIKLKDLLELMIYGMEIETVEFYNNNMTFLYSFPISEIPLKETMVKRFHVYEKEDKTVLEIIEK